MEKVDSNLLSVDLINKVLIFFRTGLFDFDNLYQY